MSEGDNLPAWDGGRGHYEAWYLTMSDPDRRAGYWIRYTLHAPARGEPEARLWFARLDRDRPERILGLNRAVPATGGFSSEPGAFEIRVGEATLRSGHATGAIDGGGHVVRWDLDFPTGEPTYRLLPDLLYRGGLAPSKPFVPNPRARYSGTIEVDGEASTLDGAPGEQGHVYGGRHAERWAWAHCSAFDGEPDTVIEALSAKGKRGPFRTPYTEFVGLRRGGRWIRFRHVSRRPAWGLGRWRIEAASRTHRLVGHVEAPSSQLIAARYLDPDGRERYCHHTDVASCRFTLFERGPGGFDEVAILSGDGTAQAEWGGRTRAPQVTALHEPVDG